MTSIVLAALWALIATVIALLPSRDRHWRAAYILIAVGLPILVYVFYQNGALVGLVVLAGGMSVLRWPVIYFYRWIRRILGLSVDKA